MADRIVINTGILTQIASRLTTLQNKLKQVVGLLDHVHLDRSSGGTLDWEAETSLQCSGMQLRGGTIEGMVRADARGLRATGSYTRELVRTLQQAAAQAEDTERSLLSMLDALKSGEESCFNEGEAAVLDAYIAPRESAHEYYGANREALRQQNEFWDTAYNQRILKNLREKILTDSNYDERSWEHLSREQKEERIRLFVREIGEIYGTEADVVFGPKAVYTDANGKKHTLEMSDGVTARYYYDLDCILINPEEESGLNYTLANIAHELRHSMQYDVVNATDSELQQKYALDGSDLDSIRNAQKEWEQNFDNYVSASNNKLVRQRADQIKSQRSLSQWWFFSGDYISNEDAERYAKNELEREYYRQQVEVDAYQMNTAVNNAYAERTVAESEQQEARLAEIAQRETSPLEAALRETIYGPWQYGY